MDHRSAEKYELEVLSGPGSYYCAILRYRSRATSVHKMNNKRKLEYVIFGRKLCHLDSIPILSISSLFEQFSN